MKKPPGIFSQRIWELAISIPPGRVVTYGDLAHAAGGGGQAARSVSSILSKAPKGFVIPWHRIVYAGGRVWLDERCKPDRLKRYKKEGIQVDEKGRIMNFDEVHYDLR